MCGFCGYLHREDQPVKRADLKAMNQSLAHRGPDGESFHFESNLGLAHRRLKIIDLSENARQPMTNEDGTIWLVFNGEIYNFSTLRTTLEEMGHRFASKSDSEVIVHGYEEWGADCFARLHGMFAIALWDARTQRLILARDRVGKKPLYYSAGNGHFVFGSELKAIMRYPYFEKRISDEALSFFLSFGYVPAPLSIFENTAKVMPGTCLIYQNGHLEKKSFWDLPAYQNGRSTYAKRSETEILEELDDRLRQSVAKRLISDVPIGFFLSGGIDSSLICAMAAGLTNRIETYSIGFEDARFDESRHAREVANHLGTEHHELIVNPQSFLEFFPEIVTYYDEPFSDSSLIPTYYLSKFTRQNVTVALSGDGGDELFCGYTKYPWIYYSRKLGAIPRSVRAPICKWTQSLRHDGISKASAALQFRNELELMLWMSSIWKPGEIEDLIRFRLASIETSLFYDTFVRYQSADPLTRMMAIDIKTYLSEDIMHKVDRASMANGLETRAPLLDHAVVELAMQIPLSMKFRRGQQKYLLKKLLEKYLPKALFQRPKHGFEVPIPHWFRHELRPLLEHYLNPERLRRQNLFDLATVQHYYQRHQHGGFNYSQKLFNLLIFQLWHDRYLERSN